MTSRRTSTPGGLGRTRLPAVALLCVMFLAPTLGPVGPRTALAARSASSAKLVESLPRVIPSPATVAIRFAPVALDMRPAPGPVELAIPTQELADPTRTEFVNEAVTSRAAAPPLLLIGDSILHGVRLRNIAIGDSDVEWMTQEGRQASALPELITEATANGRLNEDGAVVIHLGTNGWLPDFEEMVAAEVSRVGSRPVYLVNVGANRRWETAANESLARIADNNPQVQLIDWHSEVVAHRDWLRPDGVHPTATGLEGLGELIARHVGQTS